jgi:hypothetical protein
MGLRYYPPVQTWSPRTSLPGLLAYGDWSTSRFQDSDRTTPAVAAADPVFRASILRASAANTTRPTLATGPVTNRLVTSWDGVNNLALYEPSSPWFAGKALSIFAVFKFTPTVPNGYRLMVAGKGEVNANGMAIRAEANGVINGTVTTGGVSNPSVSGDKAGLRNVVLLSYSDAAGLSLLKVRGQSAVTAATSGALTFNASDTAFWVGAPTASGEAANAAFVLPLSIECWGVTTDTYTTEGTATAFVNNLAAYAGVP